MSFSLSVCPALSVHVLSLSLSLYWLLRSDKTVLATAGCQTDVVTLRRMLSARLTQ